MAIFCASTMAADSFNVLELRRYTIKDGERAHFATYFEAYFPEAMQQLGAMAAGAFLDRNNPAMFTWIRGFHDMDERARANDAFYYGQVWKEHRSAANALIVDSDNVLLLRPIDDQHPLLILPAVDPVSEPDGARGVVVAMLFAVKPEQLDAFVTKANAELSRLTATGIHDAGMFVTLNAKNNFPQLPVREDGPYVFWLGVAKNDAMVASAEVTLKQIAASNALRSEAEWMVLDPCKRSRLRWLSSW